MSSRFSKGFKFLTLSGRLTCQDALFELTITILQVGKFWNILRPGKLFSAES